MNGTLQFLTLRKFAEEIGLDPRTVKNRIAPAGTLLCGKHQQPLFSLGQLSSEAAAIVVAANFIKSRRNKKKGSSK